MDDTSLLGPKRIIDGQLRIQCLGYWIKTYEVPEDTLGAKKRLIEALTRRLFNHVEHGLNVPGERLDEARAAYDNEIDPQRRRVKGAMLAGALFNRATDIFTKLVEIQALGVTIAPDNALMRECGEYLQEALSLGKLVLHRSGEESIDELWGEPLKAFAFPVEEFYRSRYVKIAMTMRDIDRICDELIATFDGVPMWSGIAPLVRDLATAARTKTETLRTDHDVFEVWTSFVVAGENLARFTPRLSSEPDEVERRRATQGLHAGEGLDRVHHPREGDDAEEHARAFRAAAGVSRSAGAGSGAQRCGELRRNRGRGRDRGRVRSRVRTCSDCRRGRALRWIRQRSDVLGRINPHAIRIA
jgi:hypothetical protein